MLRPLRYIESNNISQWLRRMKWQRPHVSARIAVHDYHWDILDLYIISMITTDYGQCLHVVYCLWEVGWYLNRPNPDVWHGMADERDLFIISQWLGPGLPSPSRLGTPRNEICLFVSLFCIPSRRPGGVMWARGHRRIGRVLTSVRSLLSYFVCQVCGLLWSTWPLAGKIVYTSNA